MVLGVIAFGVVLMLVLLFFGMEWFIGYIKDRARKRGERV